MIRVTIKSRKAGIALYLPLFHSDIQEFLELRLKTGTQEKRAHSIQIGVCINDEFMRRLEKREMWTLFDPYEFEKVMGVNLNKLYDLKKLGEGETPNKEEHAFTYYYRKAENSGQLQLAKKVQATEIYKGIYQSRKTSGVPYLFFSDTVNRLNPNKHEGMIYSSNLC